MTAVKNIVFDFDGTLVDTAPLIVATMQATIAALGLSPKSDTECRATIGLRLEDIPSVLWPHLSGLDMRYAETYRRLFEDQKLRINMECFPHVVSTLRCLHASGFNLAIASSRNRESLLKFIEDFGIADCFCMIVGGDDVKHGKPAPDAVVAICVAMDWNAAETLVVGDAVFDIMMGRNAGSPTVAVTYGNQSREQLLEALPSAVVSTFASLYPVAQGVSAHVAEYAETEIIPRYVAFDKAHQESHVRQVVEQSLVLASHYPNLNRDMVYVVAAFHDLGLVNGRENHHIDSGDIMAGDCFVKANFSVAQIAQMREAIEDHRASGKTKPRNEYGLIVAEADRFIDAEIIVRRTIQYGLANYPELDRDGHYKRAMQHLEEKYGPNGYLKIWIPWSDNARRLKQLHTLMADTSKMEELLSRIFEDEVKQP